MNKQWSKLLTIIPLLFINIFNISLILYKLKGKGYLREPLKIVYDYFFGFHLIPFVLVLLILLSLYLYKKNSLSQFLYKIFLLLLLFFTAINVSLFPEIMELRGGQEKFSFIRKNSSLKEAIFKSPAKDAKDAKYYIQMNQYLKNKTLVFPFFAPLERDVFLKAFVSPEKILKEEYSYKIAKEDYEFLKKYPKKFFKTQGETKEIREYTIIDPFTESNVFILFTYDNNLIFVPSDLTKQHNLNIHD